MPSIEALERSWQYEELKDSRGTKVHGQVEGDKGRQEMGVERLAGEKTEKV